MFETSVVRVQARAADRRLGLLTLSVAAHAAIITAIVATSLASVKMPNRAPNQMTIPIFDHLPPALGTPDARPAQRPATPRQPQTQRTPAPQTVVAPTTIPPTTEAVAATSTGSDSETTGTGEPGILGVPWGSPVGVGDGPPATTTAVEPTGPLVAGIGDVKAPIVLRRVSPPYPRQAAVIHLSGFVIVECIIDKTGVVRDAKVVKSTSGLFEQAALDAVQQWQFAPGTLHGRPVDTIFNLTVTFTITR
jgi:TonB family protein